MLSRTTFAFILASLGLAATATGCIIVGPIDDNTGGSNSVTTVGNGGAGGSSSDTATSSTGTGGQGGQGGTGGGSMCVGTDGSSTVASCDAMNITPSTAGGPATLCQANGMTFNPPGYDLCKHVFGIYTKGAAGFVQACLSNIGVEPSNACDQAQVDKCASQVFNAVCPSASAADKCNTIGTACTSAGQKFDTQLCQTELNPFNDKATTELVTCINQTDPSVKCQQAYDDCYAKLTTY